MLKPTEEQEAALAATRGSSASLMLDALAGTGKTSTLGMLSHQVKGPALALAFNRSIAEELRNKFPGNFEVKTMNGLGYGALRRALPKVAKWELDSKKLGKLISKIDKERKLKLSSEDWDSVRRLVQRAQLAGLRPGELAASEGLCPDSPENWDELAEDCWIAQDDKERLCEVAYAVLVDSNDLVERGLISFDDQVYWPIVNDAKFTKYQTVLVDEAQDLNGLNHAALARSVDRRLIVCGDPRQSIYGFRGSVNDSMGRIRGVRSDWTDLGLTMTFRCPEVVVERQLWHVPRFRAAASNAVGRVENWRSAALGEESWDFSRLMALRREDRKDTIGILCRNNAPLFGLAFKLLRKHIGAVMLGNDLAKGLLALSRKIEKDDKVGVREFLAKLAEWQQTEVSLAESNGHDERVAGIVDRAECLRAVASNVADVGALRVALEKLFAQTEGVVQLGSIHRSKGLEWDIVLHLDPWRVPSKYAKKRAKEGDDRELQQEWNLKYVCETRTRYALVEANLEDFT